MVDQSPPANGVKAGEVGIQTIQRTNAALKIVETSPKLSQQRPKSAHCDFRESRRWAESNAKWIDNDNADIQHTSTRRRASEDLLRSQPLLDASLASNTKTQSHYRRISSDTESLARAQNLGCLSRSLRTANWLNFRENTAHRKKRVHHQFGRLVRKITDTSNWASKEPTATLDELDERNEIDSLARGVPKPNSRKLSSRGVVKLSKKPGMDNIRAQTEAADKTQEQSSELDADAIINLNATEDTPKLYEKIPTLYEKDVEETKRRSADLQEALSQYHSDRYGNLLPEINTDAIGELSTGAQQTREQGAASASALGPRYASEQSCSLDSIENNAWKISNPSSGKSLAKSSLSPPHPGPRISSRHGAASLSTPPCMEGSPLAGRSGVSARAQSSHTRSPDSLAIVVKPLEIVAAKDKTLVAPLQDKTAVNSLSVFGAPPTKSTDTLTAIAFEALGSNRPLTPSSLADAESVALKPSTRPTKLHSGFVSSVKAPGEAPNRPLPDLPEVPSPKSSESLRRDAGSGASSRSRRSLQRMSTQPSHNRRNPSLVSNASSNLMLQETNSPHGSPQRRSGSVKKSSSVKSFSGNRSSDLSNLTNATDPDQASIEKFARDRSSELGQIHDFAALVPIQDARDAVTHYQRIHDKRLQDVASARARRGKRAIREEHQSIQVHPVAEDFPPPPTSHPPSRATENHRKSDPKKGAPTANTSAVYLPNSADLQRPQAEHITLVPDRPFLASHTQASQLSRATSRSRGASPVTTPAPTHVSVPISNVTEPLENRLDRKANSRYVSPQSNVTIAHSQTAHRTPTPPLSETSTPSSDEGGTGVVGVKTANKARMQKGLRLSSSDLAAMVTDMHAMRERLDAQMRKIRKQSKQIRAIEMHKLRVVEAVNALVAVVSDTNTTVTVSQRRRERQVISPSMNPEFDSYSRPDRDSIASASTTVASAVSGSSDSGSSNLTFITEPEAFGNGLNSPPRHETMEFDMDFDRMQELIKLDRKKVPLRPHQNGKASRGKKGNTAECLRVDI